MQKMTVRAAVENRTHYKESLWFGLPTDIYPVADIYLEEEDNGLYTVEYIDDMARTQRVLVPSTQELAIFDRDSSEDVALFTSLC